VEHGGDIMELITDRIRNADAVVADITNGNPNVQYEVGLAHANHIPTILIMRAGGQIPFDLRGVNIILYENVTLLRKRLTNTPVRQAESVLKCPDDRKNRVVSAQATYPCGSSAVGGRVCEQRHAADRVLRESRFEL
jgi:hypothetical protein